MKKCLYIVDYPRKTEFAEAAPIDVNNDYSRYESCPKCGNRVSGALWMRPREVVLTSRKIPDFLYAYCDDSPFLLSENALQKIQDAGLVGITKAEEIEHIRFQRKSKKEVPIPKFYHIELARSMITIDHPKSRIVYGNRGKRTCCSLCRQVPATYNFFRSLSFNMDAYEGYDIFYIYELGNTVFLSQRFVDFYKENKLTNLHFDPAEKHGQWAASYFLDGNEDA